jgi:hypothetical protein
MDNSHKLALLIEWQQLAQEMKGLRERREVVNADGPHVGILGGSDWLAKEYQEKSKRIWEIKWELFGTAYMEF